jgi:hypothetical protein
MRRTRGVGIEMREIPMSGRGSSYSRRPGSGGDRNASRTSLKTCRPVTSLSITI